MTLARHLASARHSREAQLAGESEVYILHLERRGQAEDYGALECLTGRFVIGTAEYDKVAVEAASPGN